MITNDLDFLIGANKQNYDNFTISKISQDTGISRNTISHLINADDLTSYKTKTLTELCSYFGVPVGELLKFLDHTVLIKDLQPRVISENIDSKRLKLNFSKYEIQSIAENKYTKKTQRRAPINIKLNTGITHLKTEDENLLGNNQNHVIDVPVLFITISDLEENFTSDFKGQSLDFSVVLEAISYSVKARNDLVIKLVNLLYRDQLKQYEHAIVVDGTNTAYNDLDIDRVEVLDVSTEMFNNELENKYFEIINKVYLK